MKILHKVHQPTNWVFDHLANPVKFVSVHPVINKMIHLSGNKYMVHETLNLGPFLCAFTYTATVLSNSAAGLVRMTATVMKAAVIEISFKIMPQGNHSIVIEEILFRTWLPITSRLETLFFRQHTRLFRNIENIN